MPSTLTSLDRARAAYVETMLQSRPRTLELRLLDMARVTPEWARSLQTNGSRLCAEDVTVNNMRLETS